MHAYMHRHAYIGIHTGMHTHERAHTHMHTYRTKYNSGRKQEIRINNPLSLIPSQYCLNPSGVVSKGLAGILTFSDGAEVERQGQVGCGLGSVCLCHLVLAKNTKDSKNSKFEPGLPSRHEVILAEEGGYDLSY